MTTEQRKIFELEQDVKFLKEQLLATVRIMKDMSQEQAVLVSAVKLLVRGR